jgi:sugar O-acyltransferase (sialic acid O-acetyltransferase NeuD family)
VRGLVIVGAGDHGRVILELVRAAGLPVAGFVEPGPEARPPGGEIDGCPILGTLATPTWIAAADGFVVALGANDARSRAYQRCLALELRPQPVVHPTAHVLGGASIGPGAQVCAGAVIGVGASVGANVIVNTGATVDHDDELQADSFVAPGAHLAGRVVVGEGAWVGLGAVVLSGVRLGARAVVAAGAVVLADVPDGSRVAGVPARAMPAAHDAG